MTSKRVSTRYAKALLQFAIEQNMVDAVVEDFRALEKAITESRELRRFLITPVIGELVKSRVLKEIFGGRLTEMMYNFIALLARKGRSSELPAIVEAFNYLMYRHRNVVPVTITLATELGEDQKSQIIDRLRQMCGREVDPGFVIDPEIIGGFSARFEDTMVDASVRHQLERLRQSLIEGGAVNWIH